MLKQSLFFWRSLRRDRDGGVALVAGLSLPVVLGGMGLAVDLGRGMEQRMWNQRSADSAALGAAMAHSSTMTNAGLTAVARDVVRSNGLTNATVVAELINNFPNQNDLAVRVTVTTELPFTLARVVGAPANFNVVSQSHAVIASRPSFAAPCFFALNSGSESFRTSGGATVNTPNCTVAAIGEVHNNSTGITAADIVSGTGQIRNEWGALNANTLRFATSFVNPPWNNAVPPANRRINQATQLVDPWANSPELAAARSLLRSFTTIPTLSNPATPGGGPNWRFEWNRAPAQARGGNGVWEVLPGDYTINSLTIDGGVTVRFLSDAIQRRTVTISGGFNNSGARATFGDMNLLVNGGFRTGSSGVTFGNGLLHIGSGTVTFNGASFKGDGDVIINAPFTLGGGSSIRMSRGAHRFRQFNIGGGGFMVAGDGDFQASEGINIDGDSELSVGNGAFLYGPRSSNGRAIDLAGSARLFMGDGPFSANGHIETQGGSRIRFPITNNHFIHGNMNIRGSALFGAGRYTISGNFVNGTGGTVWPFTSPHTGREWGRTIGSTNVAGFDMAGTDVTFILGGTVNLAGGARTFLRAPETTTTGGGLRDMLVHSETASATNWAAGAHSTFIGTIYLPRSTVTMSGGSSNLSAGQCFTLIADRIAATGGAVAGSACQSVIDAHGGGGGATALRLVR